MKIKRITLEEYQQFRNFTLDLTYPKGHAKAGQPLDKVCFIGQSGTGKTTLLNLVDNLIDIIEQLDKEGGVHISLIAGTYEVSFGKENFELTPKNHRNLYINNKPAFEISEIGGDVFSDDLGFGKIFRDKKKNIKKLLIYFAAELLANQDFLYAKKKQPKRKIEETLQTEKQILIDNQRKKVLIDLVKSNLLIRFTNIFHQHIWEYIIQDIIEYDEKVKEKGIDFLQISKDINNFDKKFHEFRNWIIQTPNPRKELAEKCLNPILEKFQLQMDIENADGLIKIKHKDGSPIPNRGLSTGTKQVILTALPLYKFDTKDTIILFDEPERSLFPDIQQELVEHYVSLAPTAQFFFATHSPMIASSFEPYERFILTFDEEGYVTSKSCWRGDAPKGADPNDILIEDFRLPSYRNKFGQERWEEYVALHEKIDQIKDEKERKILLTKLRKLGNLYNFESYEENY